MITTLDIITVLNDGDLYASAVNKTGIKDKSELALILFNNHYKSLADLIEFLRSSFDLSQYPFERKAVKDIERLLGIHNVIFITGPRRCGKSIAMMQANSHLPNATYYNLKQVSDKVAIYNKICDSIEKDEDVIYFVDEVHQWDLSSLTISGIYNTFKSKPHTHTKVVMSGSQSRTLLYYMNKDWGGDCGHIAMDFISYSEWLEYYSLDCSYDSYINYIMHSNDFIKVYDVKQYLESCLQDTVTSNEKLGTYLSDTDIDGVTEQLLFDLLLAIMVILHNHTTYSTLVYKGYLDSSLATYFRKKYTPNMVSDMVNNYYSQFKSIKGDVLRRAINFLYKSGLITITEEHKDIQYTGLAHSILTADYLSKKPDVIKELNLCIKHPMFYVSLLRLFLSDEDIKNMDHGLLGSIVECEIRRLLPDTNCCEVRTNDDVEVDYVNTFTMMAIEVTVSDSHKNNFHIIPASYEKIMLTRDKDYIRNGIRYVPFYKFIGEFHE